jgi:carbon-monoxide dehydrogenase medium subunit
MYPAAFEYHAPSTLQEALGLLGRYKDDGKVLAGGHSLIPMMKLRLAQPKHLIDLRKVPGLGGIREDGGAIVIGTMATHWQVESSSVLQSRMPIVSETASVVGDPQVRNLGTLGGSLAHADPAADQPATMIAVGAEFVCEGPRGRRTVKVDDWFQGLMATALGEDEILVEIRIPRGVEAGLVGKKLDQATIEAAASKAAEGVDVQADLQGSVDYKSHLCRVFAKRAVLEAVKRARG